jgi:hypothetical protein
MRFRPLRWPVSGLAAVIAQPSHRERAVAVCAMRDIVQADTAGRVPLRGQHRLASACMIVKTPLPVSRLTARFV